KGPRFGNRVGKYGVGFFQFTYDHPAIREQRQRLASQRPISDRFGNSEGLRRTIAHIVRPPSVIVNKTEYVQGATLPFGIVGDTRERNYHFAICRCLRKL